MHDTRLRNWTSLLILLTCPVGFARSQEGQTRDRPEFERWRDYEARTRNKVFRDSVDPHWFGEQQNRFWYRIDTAEASHEYVLVDAATGDRRQAFDHARLAELLAEITGRKVVDHSLRLDALTFEEKLDTCRFRFAGRNWEFALPDGPLREIKSGVAGVSEGLPAEKQIARSRSGGDSTSIQFENRLDTELHYFWVMSDGALRFYGSLAAGTTHRQHTYDGHAWVLKDQEGDAVASFVAASTPQSAVVDDETIRPRQRRGRGNRRRRASSPDGRFRVEFEDHNVIVIETGSDQRTVVTEDGSANAAYGGRVWWSPDSNHFVVFRTEPGLHRQINLIESAPEDSIHAQRLTIPYAKPGDELDNDSVVLFSRESDWTPRLIEDRMFENPFDLRELRWHQDSKSFSFLYNQRGHQVLRLITVDAESALPRITIDETSDTFICYSRKTFLHRVSDTDQWIWMSERSGWNHLYLIDAASGEVDRAITSGEWVVRQVERVDEQNRQLYLKVSGIDENQDPYHEHLVRVDFDGRNFVRLTRGDGNHQWRFSPDRKYLIDNYSRVDLPPVTELRDASDGRLICELEQADASSLFETGWRPPERFVAKGRDGVTEIHGVIVRPTRFDPGQKYPVLEHIYAGPHSSFVPKDFGTHRSLYSMAELGFIVVKIDGMGTSNRSKAFHDVCWKNLGDSGFPDRIAWMKAAAEDRPEMDLNRVGIWGGSAGGQSAMRALIAHGDFYHAAVADCGCHDNRVDKIWWNEQWMGWPIGPHYEAQSNVTQAHRVQGDLMLIWGELDRNVDPASTMQVVDALIRADKDFEQLIVPGHGHGAAGHPYAKRRQAEFFVRKLKLK